MNVSNNIMKRAALWTVAGLSAFFLALSMLAFYGPLRVFAVQSVLKTAHLLPARDDFGQTNILLLGVRDEELSSSDLTDTIIIASIDADTRSVSLLSIPRDLTIYDTPGSQAIRINQLYADFKSELERQGLSGSSASILALNRLGKDIAQRMDIDIHGVIKIDFTGFTDVIDAVGGVDIEVADRLVDPYYPIREGKHITLTVEPGLQHFDGEMALRYARSRSTTSDFDRSKRQQQILSALVETVKRRGLRNLALFDEFSKIAGKHVESTFSVSELTGLAGILSTVSTDRIVRMNLTYFVGGNGTAEPGGFIVHTPKSIAGSGALLMPLSLSGKPSDWGQLQMLAKFLFLRRDVYLAKPVIALQSAGARNTEVNRLRNELIRYGFTVKEEQSEGSAPRENVQESSSVLMNAVENKESARFFGELLGMPYEPGKHPGLRFFGGSSEADIQIQLGKNFVFEPFAKKLAEQEDLALHLLELQGREI